MPNKFSVLHSLSRHIGYRQHLGRATATHTHNLQFCRARCYVLLVFLEWLQRISGICFSKWSFHRTISKETHTHNHNNNNNSNNKNNNNSSNNNNVTDKNENRIVDGNNPTVCWKKSLRPAWIEPWQPGSWFSRCSCRLYDFVYLDARPHPSDEVVMARHELWLSCFYRLRPCQYLHYIHDMYTWYTCMIYIHACMHTCIHRYTDRYIDRYIDRWIDRRVDIYIFIDT